METILTDDGLNLSYKHAYSEKPNNTICILAHGITVDMSEGGIFDRMSMYLREKGIDTIQFDFRGHGNSDGNSKGMTIAGEILDLCAVINYCLQNNYKDIYLLSASFGAVSTSCLPIYYKSKISKLVLWNPVLDLLKTFIDPVLPWGKASFNTESLNKMLMTGSLFIDGEFEISSILIDEFKLYKLIERLREYNIKTMIIHGDKDTYVPFDVAEDTANALNNCKFIRIKGAEHGFGRKEEEELVVKNTLLYLTM